VGKESKNSRAGFVLGIAASVFGSSVVLAPPEDSFSRQCAEATGSLARFGARLFFRDVGEGDPVTFRDGFFGVKPAATDENSKPAFVPARLLPLYRSPPGQVVRAAAKTPLYFMRILDGAYHAGVNKPVGWLSERMGMNRKRTTWLTEGLLLGLGGVGLSKLSDVDDAREREIEREKDGLEALITHDFRFEGIRQSREMGKVTDQQAQRLAADLLDEYKKFYERSDNKAPAGEQSRKEDLQFIRLAGILPEGVDFAALPPPTQQKLADINHLLFTEYRVLAAVEGVDEKGQLRVSAEAAADPNVKSVLAHIQGPDETFSRNLLQLYQKGHNGKTIELKTLKRFLMYDAWVRAIDYGETVVGRDAGPTLLHLREEGVEDLRKYLVDKPAK